MLVPNPAEVERAFDVPLVELIAPEVYPRGDLDLPGRDRAPRCAFFELIGDTVWGAAARMLVRVRWTLVLATRQSSTIR